MVYCAIHRVSLFKRIYYVNVLYRRDQICLVKFLFTSSREYFISFHSFSSNTGLLFSFRILSYTETSAVGIQFPQFLLISIPAAVLTSFLYFEAFISITT